MDLLKIIRKLADTSASFYLYDERKIVENIISLQSNFADIKFLYSVKCNNNKNVLKSVFGKGLGADAASVREVLLARDCGLSKEEIYYSAPGKTLEDIRAAIDNSVIIADSVLEIEQLNKLAKERSETLEVGIRLNPNFTFFADNGVASKFGIDEEQAAKFKIQEKYQNLNIVGIHVHLKSQELNASVLKRYYEKMIALAERFSDLCGSLKFINMGSGLGIPYGKTEKPLDLVKLGASAAEEFKQFKHKFPNTELLIETGRFVVGDSGSYVTRVLDKKISHGTTYLILQNTLNGFVRPSIERLVAHYSKEKNPIGCEPLFTCKNAFEFQPLTDNIGRETVTLVGNLCTSSDIVAENIEMPCMEPDDSIIISNAGAYGAVLSPMQFSSLNKPQEFFLTLDGKIKPNV